MPDPGFRRPAGRAVITLSIAALGGALMSLADFPGGWLTGSLIAVAVAALRGVPLHVPNTLKIASYAMVGLVAGSGVRPETLRQIWTWPLSFLFLALMMAVSMPLTVAYLRRVARWDPMTALLASFPGSLSLVIATAEDVGADLRPIVVSQTLRVLLLLLIIPLAMPWLGHVDGISAGIGGDAVAPGELVVALALAVAGGLAAQQLRVPGGLVIGALIAAAGLYASGAVDTAVPPELFAAGLVVVGAITGSRFRPGDSRLIGSVLPHALAVFALMVAVAALCAFLIGLILPIPLSQALMAYAPGALEAMIILAVIAGVDVAFVAAHHAVRFFAISLVVPMLGMRHRRPRQDNQS